MKPKALENAIGHSLDKGYSENKELSGMNIKEKSTIGSRTENADLNLGPSA